MDIDDLNSEQLESIRREADLKRGIRERNTMLQSKKNISTATVLKLVCASIGCALCSGLCAGIPATFPYSLLLFGVVLYVFAIIFGILSLSFIIASGVYIGINSK